MRRWGVSVSGEVERRLCARLVLPLDGDGGGKVVEEEEEGEGSGRFGDFEVEAVDFEGEGWVEEEALALAALTLIAVKSAFTRQSWWYHVLQLGRGQKCMIVPSLAGA